MTGDIHSIRQSGKWMSMWDDRILELLRAEDPMPPSKVVNYELIKTSKSNATKRMLTLNEHGLIDDLGQGVYRINEKGEKYLRGEIDVSE